MNSQEPLFAHSTSTPDLAKWERLDHHLRAVGERSSKFARIFGADILGNIAGLLHDLGKAKPGFQAYLHNAAPS